MILDPISFVPVEMARRTEHLPGRWIAQPPRARRPRRRWSFTLHGIPRHVAAA